MGYYGAFLGGSALEHPAPPPNAVSNPGDHSPGQGDSLYSPEPPSKYSPFAEPEKNFRARRGNLRKNKFVDANISTIDKNGGPG